MLRPMSGDPERDDPKQRPAPPAGVLGGAGKRAESAPVETTARVPKSAFAHTIAGLNVPGAAAPVQSEAEPLRDPSDRPAPVPYKRAHGAWGGTLPMPEAGKPAGSQSVERMIAARPGPGAGSDGSPVAVRPAKLVGTPEAREPTVRMPTTAAAHLAASARPPSNRPVPAAPPPSGAPAAMPSPPAPAPRSPAPKAPAAHSAAPRPSAPSARAAEPKREDPSVPRLSLGVEKIPSREPATTLEVSGQSQPLQLALDAGDQVESSLRPASATPQRSLLPWIALAAIAVLGGLAFMFMRGGEPTAPAAPERVEAVPAAAPSEVPPTPGTATTQDKVPEAAAPKAAVVAPAAPAETKPVAPSAAPVVEAKKEAKKVAAKAPAKKARASKKRASSSEPVLKVTPEGESSLEAAVRAAGRLSEPADEELEPPAPPSPSLPSPD